jgi:DNA polymerase-1
VNTIIQGTAADIVMCAMIKCYYDKRLRELGVKMLLQIHDEIVFECPAENTEEACRIIQENMENPGIKLRVPLKAAPGVGDNWVEAK